MKTHRSKKHLDKLTRYSLIVLALLIITNVFSQSEILNINYDFAETKRERDFERFQSINRAILTLENEERLIGKNYEISIEEYRNGILFREKSIINTAVESLPPVLENFEIAVMSQHINGKVKLGFMHQNFSNIQDFEIDELFGFKDGEFLLRDTCAGDDKVAFEAGEKFQIFLITPPNRDESKGRLGYCEVSQGGIDVTAWYKQYEIPQFFLVYMTIFNNKN